MGNNSVTASHQMTIASNSAQNNSSAFHSSSSHAIKMNSVSVSASTRTNTNSDMVFSEVGEDDCSGTGKTFTVFQPKTLK